MDYLKMSGQFIAILLLLIKIPSAIHAATALSCGVGYYQDRISDQCLPCSKCTTNEIVRRPCSEGRDTVCGPFYEFETFNQKHAETQTGEGGDALSRDREFNLFKVHDSEEEEQGENTEEKEEDQKKEEPREEVSSEAGDYLVTAPCAADLTTTRWQQLCYMLIVVLALLTLFFLFYIAYTQVQMRKIAAKVKLQSISDSKEEPFYCYTQVFTEDCSESTAAGCRNSGHKSHQRSPNKVDKRLKESLKSNSNDYAIQMPSGHEHSKVETKSLLPVIAEGTPTDADHVRVLYTSAN